MKTLVIVAILFEIFSFSLFAKVTFDVQGIDQLINIEIEDVRLSPKGDYSSPELVGVDYGKAYFKKVGFPKLPVLRFVLKTTNDDVEVEFSKKKHEINIDSPLWPNQNSLLKLPGIINNWVPEEKIEGLFPVQNYDLKRIDDEQVMLTIYPVQYDQFSNKVFWTPSIHVKVTDPTFFKNKSVLFDTHDLARPTFAFVVGRAFRRTRALNNYIEFKQGQGYNVIRLDVPANMSADSVRSWIQVHQAQKLLYVMIIGDHAQVKSFQGVIKTGITDHYYRFFGNPRGESGTFGAKIHLGRVPAANESELEGVLAKFMRYQQEDISHSDWIGKTSFLSNKKDYKQVEETHDFILANYFAPREYRGTFPNRSISGGDRFYENANNATTADLKLAFNQGRGLIQYSGHGLIERWSGPHFYWNDVKELTTNALPLVVANACSTGNFYYDHSVGKSWIIHPHGAVAYVGSIGYSYTNEDDVFERAFYSAIFDLGKKRFGEILDYALSQVWIQYGGEGMANHYWESYTLLGDPSMEFHLNQ